MLSAKEAYEKTKYQDEINEIKKAVEDKILESVENGCYSCIVKIRVDTDNYVRIEIVEWLTKLGYTSVAPKKHRIPINASVDQTRYYDDLVISWRKEDVGGER